MGRDRRGKDGGRRGRETEVEGEGKNNHHNYMSSASHEVATLMQHTHHCTLQRSVSGILDASYIHRGYKTWIRYFKSGGVILAGSSFQIWDCCMCSVVMGDRSGNYLWQPHLHNEHTTAV